MKAFKVRERVNIIKDNQVFATDAQIVFKDTDGVFTVNYHDGKTGYFYKNGKHIFVDNIYLEKIVDNK